MEITKKELKNEILCVWIYGNAETKPSCKYCRAELKKACNKRCDFIFSLIHKTAYDVIEEIQLHFLEEKEAKKKINYSKLFKYLSEIQ